jgi:acyl-ACP thioesterase
VAGAPRRIERTYRVRFDEAGPDGYLRSSGYLRYAQDLAWIHSEGAGFGRDWYRDRALTWLVRAIELDIVGDAAYGTELQVSTEVVGFRRVWARRRNEFRAAESERAVATAITDWVLLNERGAPTRVPREIVDIFAEAPTDYTPLRLGLPSAPSDATPHKLSVRRSELDPMAHVNNAAYLDYLDEHRHAGKRILQPLPTPRRYRAEFVVAAEPGDQLIARGWQDEIAWCYLLVDDGGRELFRARLETDSASWVGG